MGDDLGIWKFQELFENEIELKNNYKPIKYVTSYRFNQEI
jgi:hypothetical protein